MGRIFHIGDIPTATSFGEGFYNLRAAKFSEHVNDTNGSLYYALEFRVVEPDAFKNRAYTETLFIGTTPFSPGDSEDPEWIEYAELDDPMGEHRLTHKYAKGLRTLKYILVAMDHPLANADEIDIDEIFADFNVKNPRDQWQVCARMHPFVNANGKDRVEITKFYPVGTEKPRLLNTATAEKPSANGTGPRKPARNNASKLAAAAARSFVEDDDELE